MLNQNTRRRTARKTLVDLPPELIQMILSKLPQPDIFESRYLCKTWTHLTKERRFVRMHFSNSCKNPRPSSLLLYSPSTTSLDLYVVRNIEKCDSAFKLTKIPFKSWLPQFKIMGSSNGFVCIADDTWTYSRIIIFNPVDGDWFSVPECPVHGRIKWKLFGFGYNPNTNEHKLIRMRDTTKDKMVIEMHILGSDYWKRKEFDRQKVTGSRKRRHGVFLNGCLYWACLNDEDVAAWIGAFDTETGKLGGYDLPPFIIGQDCSRLYIGDLGGLLSIAFDWPFSHSLDVWQMSDYEKGTWTVGYKIPKPQCCAVCKSIARIEPLGILMDGNVLINFQGVHARFFSYDPRSQILVEILGDGFPDRYEAYPHTGTLLRFNELLEREENVGDTVILESTTNNKEKVVDQDPVADGDKEVTFHVENEDGIDIFVDFRGYNLVDKTPKAVDPDPVAEGDKDVTVHVENEDGIDVRGVGNHTPARTQRTRQPNRALRDFYL